MWRPCWESARARFTESVLLPTPPFALLTAMTFRTLGMSRFSGRPSVRVVSLFLGSEKEISMVYLFSSVQRDLEECRIEGDPVIVSICAFDDVENRCSISTRSRCQLTNGFSWLLLRADVENDDAGKQLRSNTVDLTVGGRLNIRRNDDECISLLIYNSERRDDLIWERFAIEK